MGLLLLPGCIRNTTSTRTTLKLKWNYIEQTIWYYIPFYEMSYLYNLHIHVYSCSLHMYFAYCYEKTITSLIYYHWEPHVILTPHLSHQWILKYTQIQVNIWSNRPHFRPKCLWSCPTHLPTGGKIHLNCTGCHEFGDKHLAYIYQWLSVRKWCFTLLWAMS